LVNPAKPEYQSVGVFSLELARIYAYLYQKSNKKYTILHALDGYDEISLTGNFKTFSNAGEQIYTLEKLGFARIKPQEIGGGHTVDDSAKIFTNVLNGLGTTAQNNVVLCNAALAIKTIHPEKSFADCFYEAEESLLSKRALNSFETLLSIAYA